MKVRWADAWADALANAWADAAENRPRPGIILLIKSEVQILMYTQLSSYFFFFFSVQLVWGTLRRVPSHDGPEYKHPKK